MIHDFTDFCSELIQCGFSMGGGNAKGIYALIPYGWEEQNLVDSPIQWHTGDPETDPWEWRMRVLEERSDIAYGKVFFGTSGYITKEWYPYFYSIRRKEESLQEAYENGTISQMAKRIFDIVSERGMAALHEIKQIGGFSKEDNSAFERAITELQMRMFLTMCGRMQKINKNGEGYGWNSTVFMTVEDFWERNGTSLVSIAEEEAFEAIRNQILKLNPQATERKINKFIRG